MIIELINGTTYEVDNKEYNFENFKTGKIYTIRYTERWYRSDEGKVLGGRHVSPQVAIINTSHIVDIYEPFL